MYIATFGMAPLSAKEMSGSIEWVDFWVFAQTNVPRLNELRWAENFSTRSAGRRRLAARNDRPAISGLGRTRAAGAVCGNLIPSGARSPFGGERPVGGSRFSRVWRHTWIYQQRQVRKIRREMVEVRHAAVIQSWIASIARGDGSANTPFGS